MSEDLQPPADLNDHAAVADWAVRVTAHLESLGMDEAAQATATLIETAGTTSPEELEKKIGQASLALTLATLADLEERYAQLAIAARGVLPETADGSDDRTKLEQAIEGYETAAHLFGRARALMNEGGPDAKAELERTVAEAQAKLNAIAS